MARTKEIVKNVVKGRVKTAFGKRLRTVKQTTKTRITKGSKQSELTRLLPRGERGKYLGEVEKTKRFISGTATTGTIASEAVAPFAANQVTGNAKSSGLTQAIQGGLVESSTKRDEDEDNPEVI